MSADDHVKIATIDSPSADVIREALADAGITSRFVEVKPANAWLQMVPRPMVDVEVEVAHEAAARAVLAQLEQEGGQAADAQWQDPSK